MKTQVLSIEQMQHLQELGVDTSEAKMCWCQMKGHGDFVMPISETSIGKGVWTMTPTFTLQDILEMLPCLLFDKYYLEVNKLSNIYTAKYIDYITDDEYEFWNGCNLLTVLYQALCWCAENGYLGGGEK